MKRPDRSMMRRGTQVRLAVALAAALTLGLAGASTASAALFVTVTPMFPATAAVGETGPASVTIVNMSTDAEAANPVAVPAVTLFPSCGSTVPGTCTAPDPGVYELNGPFAVTGSPGACPTSYTASAPDATTGRVDLTPVGGALVLDVGEACTISFTATVLKAPTIDAEPNTAGLQTAHIASVQTLHPIAGINSFAGSQSTTITEAAPTPPTTIIGNTTQSNSQTSSTSQSIDQSHGGGDVIVVGGGDQAAENNSSTGLANAQTVGGDADAGSVITGDATHANTQSSTTAQVIDQMIVIGAGPVVFGGDQSSANNSSTQHGNRQGTGSASVQAAAKKKAKARARAKLRAKSRAKARALAKARARAAARAARRR